MMRLGRRALIRAGAAAGVLAVAPPLLRDVTWRHSWDSLVAEATAEGKLSLVTWGNTWGGPSYRGFAGVVQEFQRAFPGILVDPWLGESVARVWLEKVRAARRTNEFPFDLAIVSSDVALRQGAPEGIWAPLAPLVVRPDARDDDAWRGGYAHRYLDLGGKLSFAWEHQVIQAYAVNTDLVGDGEITSIDDLLDSKWRGRIISGDPRIGSGLNSAAAVARHRGEATLRRLLVDQRPTFSAGGAHLGQALAGGSFAIALGLRPKAVPAGAEGRIRFLDLPEADFAITTSLLHFDRAPHPAASKLFANWILTREGQTLLTSSLPTNSARLDVERFEPYGAGSPTASYFEPEREANFQLTAETQRLVTNVVGGFQLAG